MDSINIGLLGLGTVGCGVIKIIEEHQDRLIHQVGCHVEVKRILVQDVKKERNVHVSSSLLTTDAQDIVQAEDIDIVIEVMGGVKVTREYILTALKLKKHVVTANKDLMALFGSELLKTASENGCDLFYEASVAGGVPILHSLVDGLASDRITKMMGIINGTTNFILTKMNIDEISFEDAVKEAHALGFTESDPSADVEGIDAARKMAILATLGFSMHIDLEDVKTIGITHVTEEDLNYSRKLGYTMKLLGIAQRDGDEVEISVQPTLLPNQHPLASIHDEFNAIYVYGETVGETMFYGPGAGSLPTASAVVSDLVGVIKNMRLGTNGRSLAIPQYRKRLKKKADIFAKYFLRIHAKDEVGAFAKITAIFFQHHVSLEKILQLPLDKENLAEIIIVTHKTSLLDYEEIINSLWKLEVVHEVKNSYRIEGEKA